MKKGQADIVSAVLIIIISIGLIATAYTWGIPLIQKNQDRAIADRVANFFDQNSQSSLPNTIEFIANNQGEQTVKLEITGFWKLNEGESSIQYTFFSKISNIAVGSNWVSLTPGADCNLFTGPAIGYVGKDRSSVVCARADKLGDGYNVTYKVWFREIDDSTATRGFKINLVKNEAGTLTSPAQSTRISYAGSTNQVSGGKTLIITQIKILFV